MNRHRDGDPYASLLRRYGPDFYRRLQGLTFPAHWYPPRGLTGAGLVGARDGASLEFKHHRPYTPGGDVRRLDWRVYGRTRRTYTRIHHSEHHPDLCLVLDTSASMAHPDLAARWTLALDLVLALAFTGLRSGYHVRLVPFSASLGETRTWRSTRELRTQAPSLLTGLRAAGATDLGLLPGLAHRWRHQGAVVVVLSDFLVDIPQVLATEQSRSFPQACGRLSDMARRRLRLAVEPVARTSRAFAGERFRLLLLQLHVDDLVKEARFVVDAETGIRLRLGWSRGIERDYQNICECHHTLLATAARQQGAAFQRFVGAGGIPVRNRVEQTITLLDVLGPRRRRR